MARLQIIRLISRRYQYSLWEQQLELSYHLKLKQRRQLPVLEIQIIWHLNKHAPLLDKLLILQLFC